MNNEDETGTGNPFEAVPTPLATALSKQGFTALTPVQEAVLAADADGRDLRIVSRTGSGKTVALGLAIGRAMIARGGATPKERGTAKPEVLVVAPTRELATQVGRELHWLFAPLRLRVACVTGGTSLGGDFRTLGSAPDVLVGTPGRLVDHLERGALDLSATTELVLDEADAMLDLGFRDELDRILASLPAERHTHLVSATFADEVLALANRHQKKPLRIEGADAGAQHADIEHLAYLMQPGDRAGALINLLLMSPDDRVLVFVRTRADAGEVADGLLGHGFRARAISGEMTQRERTSTLEAFRSGEVRVLVATDVAARGLDVRDVASVIHYDPPGSPETLTHRSGRTGRAGQKGTSILFVPVPARAKVGRLLHGAGITADLRPLPSRQEVEGKLEAALIDTIRVSEVAEAEAPRLERIARTLLEGSDPVAIVSRLLARAGVSGACEPCEVTVLDPRASRRPTRPAEEPVRRDAPRGFVKFQVSWGGAAGADPRRILAVSCRRGGISSADVGAIEILPRSSTIEVSAAVADAFAAATREPDPREPGIRFRPHRDGTASHPAARKGPPRRGGPAGPRGGSEPPRPHRPRPVSRASSGSERP